MTARGVLFLLAACVALVACGGGDAPQPGAPGAVRIATNSPAVGVMLRDLGAADALVGRSGWDVASPASVPVVGDAAGLDYERLASVRPTHVYLESGAAQPPRRLVTLGEDVGYTIRTFQLTGLDAAVTLADELHVLVGGDGRPPSADFADALRADAGLADAGRVLLLVAGDPPAALGPGSAHDELLRRMGATPAITEGGPYMPLDAEDLLAVAPDAIVVFDPNAAAGEGWRGAMEGYASLPVPAFERGRVALVGDAEALMASTSLLRVARRLRGLLAGWAAGRGG